MDHLKDQGPATAHTVNRPFKTDPHPSKINTQHSLPTSTDQAVRRLMAQCGLSASLALVVCTISGFGGVQ